MSDSDILERLRKLELRILQDMSDSNKVLSEKENKKLVEEARPEAERIVSDCAPSKKRFVGLFSSLPQNSNSNSECSSKRVDCSTGLTSESNVCSTTKSYTTLPSVSSVSTDVSTASRAERFRKNKTGVLHSHQSDSALRHLRSSSRESTHQSLPVTNQKPMGRSTSNLRLHSSSRSHHSVSSRYMEVVINKRVYDVLGPLGNGGSSKVYQVLSQADRKLLALKCVDLLHAEPAQKEAYRNEIQLLERLRNSGCVIELYDYELRGRCIYILMEMGDIDLASVLKSRRPDIDGAFILYYWKEMLNCVNVIHKERIVHSDLKPANFLIVKGKLKLIDFGIASSLPLNKTSLMTETQMGTISYMAPEVLEGTSEEKRDDIDAKRFYKVNRKADVWSLGCILYYMVYGFTPFQKYRSVFEKANAIINHPVSFNEIEDKDLLDIMKRCLEKDPVKRASVEELLDHPYTKGGRQAVFDH